MYVTTLALFFVPLLSIHHPEVFDDMLATLDPVAPTEELTESEIQALVSFLEALTDPAATQLDVTPNSVPSGLLVSDEIEKIYVPMIRTP